MRRESEVSLIMCVFCIVWVRALGDSVVVICMWGFVDGVYKMCLVGGGEIA